MAEKKAAPKKAPAKKAAPKKVPAPPAPVEAEAPDKIAQLEALANELAAAPDQGDGVHAHIMNIQRAVGGLRDAQRAWANVTNSADSVRNQEEVA